MLTNLQVNQAKGEAGMLETRKAYEYALDRIGLDLHSAGLWHEYINYMQLPRPNTPAYRALWASGAAPGQEDSQRIMTLRSNVYCIRLAGNNHVLQLKANPNCTDKQSDHVWNLACTSRSMYASVESLLCHSCFASPKLHMLQQLHSFQYNSLFWLKHQTMFRCPSKCTDTFTWLYSLSSCQCAHSASHARCC